MQLPGKRKANAAKKGFDGVQASNVELTSNPGNDGEQRGRRQTLMTAIDEDLAKVSALENKVAAIVKYQGYHDLEELIESARDGQYMAQAASGGGAHSRHLPSNDFVAAALLGPAAACENTSGCLSTNAIVAGLLLTVSLQYCISPPDPIAVLDNTNAVKIIFIICMNLSSGFSFLLIIFAAQFAVAGARAMREADKLRVLLHVDPILPLDPNSIGVVSMYGSVIFLVIGIIMTSVQEFGIGVAIACAIIFALLVSLGIKLGTGFVFAGHVSFYWKNVGHKNNTDPFDVRAMENLVRLKINIGKKMFAEYQETVQGHEHVVGSTNAL